jgi:hypothetical protein
MAARYDCRVVVVTAQDGAWRKDPFSTSARYRLVEDDARWRIYRLAAVPKVSGLLLPHSTPEADRRMSAR